MPEQNTTPTENIGLSFLSFIKGISGFAIGALLVFLVEALLLGLINSMFDSRLAPRGLGWIAAPCAVGMACARYCSSHALYGVIMSKIQTPQQRIALLSFYVGLAFLAVQLTTYGLNMGYYASWDYFWSGLHECLSFGRQHLGCEDDINHIMSRSLMYVNLIWLASSLFCAFFWSRVLLLTQWIKNGS